MLTAKEVALQLRLSARKVYAIASSGQLASHRFGGAVRFSQADVNAYVQESRRPARSKHPGTRLEPTIAAAREHELVAYFAKVRPSHRRPSR